MKFFYIKNESIILGVSVFNDIDNVSKSVPKGVDFWIYENGVDIDSIIKNKNPDGIGTGLERKE